MWGNTKNKMAPAKPPLIPISSFQELQKTLYAYSAGTTSSPPQAPNENNKVENRPGSAVSAPTIGDSNSNLSDQIQTAEPDMDQKQKRIMSNRLSSRRSWLKKSRHKANLETQGKKLEDQIVEFRSQLEFHRTKKQLLIFENQTLRQDMESVNKEILLREVQIKKNFGEMKRLMELQLMQQQQKQMQPRLPDWNIGLQEPLYNYPISKLCTSSYHVVGNGVETPYIPSELGQMGAPAKTNIQSMLNQMVELQSQVSSHPNKKQVVFLEHKTLPQKMDIPQKEIILSVAEKNKGEMNMLRELQMMPQKPLQSQLPNWNIGLQEPVPIYPISNIYPNSYQGNGVETPYIPQELGKMGIPAMTNMHEMYLSLPNYMRAMDINNSSGSFSNPNLN